MRHIGALAAALAASLIASSSLAAADDTALVQPKALIVDVSLPKAQLDTEILAARRYDSFWNMGDEALAKAALAPDFMDRTLPPGRAQGVAGPLSASAFFRQAVPDLTCEVEQMIVAGDGWSRICISAVISPAISRTSSEKASRSISSPRISIASRKAVSPRTGISKTI